jgi:thiol-disulfide isomerase/thioredoxin
MAFGKLQPEAEKQAATPQPERKQSESPEEVDMHETRHRSGVVSTNCWHATITSRWSSCALAVMTRVWSPCSMCQLTDRMSVIRLWCALVCSGQVALRHLYHTSERPLIVFYSSPSCGPCRSLKPIVSKLADEFHDKVDRSPCPVQRLGHCRSVCHTS